MSQDKIDQAARHGEYGGFVVPAAEMADDDLKFTYLGNKALGIRCSAIDIAASIAENGVVIISEGNFSFSFSLAAYFQSWSGIISTFPDGVEDHRAVIEEGYITARDSCEANQKLLLLRGRNVEATLSHMMEELKLPLLGPASPSAPYQNFKRRAIELIVDECAQTSLSRIEIAYDMSDTASICDQVHSSTLESSKVAGDLSSRHIWYQCPWKAPTSSQSTAALVIDFLNQAAICQQAGYLVMIGVINLFPYCTQYGLLDIISHPQYEFVGFDKNLIRELLLLGYSFQSRYVIDGAEFSHVTLIFKRRGE